MRNPEGRMRVCAEFSGSAGEAPTGIKVGVEAVGGDDMGAGLYTGGGQTNPPTHTCWTLEREGYPSYPASQQCHIVVGLRSLCRLQRAVGTLLGGVQCGPFQNEGTGPKAWGGSSRQEGPRWPPVTGLWPFRCQTLEVRQIHSDQPCPPSGGRADRPSWWRWS